MKPVSRRAAVAALAAAPLVLLASTVHAASPAQVTLTFRLTLTGTVPAHDTFLLTFPTNDAQFCGPCAGGHTYVLKLPRPKSTTVLPFKFVRGTPRGCTPIGQDTVSCPPSSEHVFAQVDVTPTRVQTISAFFNYNAGAAATAATPSVPTTGAGGGLLLGSGLIASGAGLLGLGAWRRKRS